MFNNLINVVIDLFTNEIFYDFKVRDAFFEILFNDGELSKITNLSAQRLKYQHKTTNVTVFANAKVKIYYNVRHTSLLLNVENYVYLRLYYKYQLFNKLNKKLFQQRCGLFLITKRVRRLVYRLNLSLV